MLVGEIGIDRNTFFNQLRWWEVRAIISGYNRRHRDIWSATRWQTYNTMAAQVGGKELAAHGINSATDLLPLPWDTKDVSKLPTKEEVAGMVDEINAINKAGGMAAAADWSNRLK
jgi:hypothetical protein